MDQLARAAQAISDETRLRILNLLALNECCVCEVMQALEISQTRASRNLKILDDAGFLKMRTKGLYTVYSLGDTSSDSFHATMVAAVRKEMQTSKTAEEDALRLQNSQRVGPGCSK